MPENLFSCIATMLHRKKLITARQRQWVCSGQQKLATALEFFQNNRSDSFGVKPPLY